MASEPYEKNGKWWIDKDPNDKLYYVGNISQALIDSATTAVDVEAIVEGVEVLEGPELQDGPGLPAGSLIAIKLGGMGDEGTDSFCTFRVTCANTEQFDRTICFNRVEN
jgi:hypothetical protein